MSGQSPHLPHSSSTDSLSVPWILILNHHPHGQVHGVMVDLFSLQSFDIVTYVLLMSGTRESVGDGICEE